MTCADMGRNAGREHTANSRRILAGKAKDAILVTFSEGAAHKALSIIAANVPD